MKFSAVFQWRIPVSVYLAYRFILMAYVICWLVYNRCVDIHTPQAWGAYLTNWTYSLLVLYLSSHCLAAYFFHISLLCHQQNYWNTCCRCASTEEHTELFVEPVNRNDELEPLLHLQNNDQSASTSSNNIRPPWYLCIVWVLFCVVSSSAVLVSIVFFGFLYPNMDSTTGISLENLQVHLLNSVIIILEHCITAVPYRLLHVVYPFFYGCLYALFSIIYWSIDHSHVMYPHFLDWSHPGLAAVYVLLLGFVFFPLLHFLFFLVYKIKMFLLVQYFLHSGLTEENHVISFA